MTTTKTNTKPVKDFWYQGIGYRRTEKGYCYMGADRISAKKFEEIEAEALHEQQERNQRIADRIRAAVEYDEREEEMNIIEIDGVKWAKDHLNGKTYRDGEECSRAEFNRAIGIGSREEGDKPARKPRKSKDVAFEAETTEGTVTLTAKQADFLRELDGAGETTLGNKGTGWWTDCITDAIGGQFASSPMTVGAMISTLCEKGLGERSKEQRETDRGRTKKVTSFRLTQKGREVWEAMGLR